MTLTSYADTWAESQQRWWDIASYADNKTDRYNQFNGFSYTPVRDSSNNILGYASPNLNYANAGQPGGPSVTVTYDKAPNVPYFVAHIEATNLKPNFAYQVKLVGKPTYGPRGAGPFTKKSNGSVVSVPDGGGEDWANSQLGHIGRWWNDSNASGNTNAVTDSVYASTYPKDTIYGYIFMGDFVTGPDGKASVNIIGQSNYHITFQDWQSGGDVRMVQDGIPGQLTDPSGNKYFPIVGNPATGPSYAYGTVQPSTNQPQKNGYQNVYLWYQYESSMTAGRPRTVNLPAGRYHCRVMLTEESFHNNYGATMSPYGGKWESVLINEDFAKDSNGQTIYSPNGQAMPDTVVSNDIVFDIKNSKGQLIAPPQAPTDIRAIPNADKSQVSLTWNHSALPNANYYFNVKRAESKEGPYLTIAGGVNTTGTSYLDNTVLPDKNYFYVISAVNCGVEGPDSKAAETAPPVATIATPTQNQNLSVAAFNSIGGNATDDTGVAQVQLKLFRTRGGVTTFWNGSAFTATQVLLPANLTAPGALSTGWNFAVTPALKYALDLGSYSVAVYAQDVNGLQSNAIGRNFTLVADSTPPIPVIDTPAQNQRLTSAAFNSITGTVTDNVGVTQVLLKLFRTRNGTTTFWNGSNFAAAQALLPATVASPGSSNTAWNFPVSPELKAALDEGDYLLVAYGQDAAGNISSAVGRNFTLNNDVTAPILTISSPTQNQSLTAVTFNSITGNATDAVGVTQVFIKLFRTRNGVTTFWNGSNFGPSQVLLPTALNSPGAANTSWVFSVTPNLRTALDSGAYLLAVYGKDAAGNQSGAVGRNFNLTTSGTVTTPDPNAVSSPSAGSS